MEEIRVTIKKDGSLVIDCNGFAGNACDVTKVAEEALGLVSREDKDEFFKQEVNYFQTNTQ